MINIVYKNTGALIPAEYNPREITLAQHDEIKASIEAFGLVDPLIVNTHPGRENVIVCGHARARIAMELGIETVPCVEVDLELERERELNIRHNHATGQFDFDKLMAEFDTEELMAWGFNEKELGGTGDPVPVRGEDEIPDKVNVKIVTCPGDVYEIKTDKFTLRLACGDAEKPDAPNKVLGGQRADLVVYDPDYSATDLSYTEAVEDVLQWIKPGGIIYGFVPGLNAGSIASAAIKALVDSGFYWSSTIAWKKGALEIGATDLHQQWQPILYGWDNRAERICPVQDRAQSDVWEFDDVTKNELLVTQRPVCLIEKMVKLSTLPGATVYDPFAGVGTTGLACAKLGRNFCGVEIDPRLVDITIRRWNDWLRESDILATVTKNGEPFSMPELYEAVGETENEQN